MEKWEIGKKSSDRMCLINTGHLSHFRAAYKLHSVSYTASPTFLDYYVHMFWLQTFSDAVFGNK